MWHVLGLVNAFTQLLVSVSTINLTIRPEFSAICLDTDISCIVYLPVLHIISAAVKTVKHCNKTDFQQGGVERCGRTSHSGPNENSNGKHQRHG